MEKERERAAEIRKGANARTKETKRRGVRLNLSYFLIIYAPLYKVVLDPRA